MLAKFFAVVVLILSAGSLVLYHPATARDVDVSDATFPGCNPEQIATLQDRSGHTLPTRCLGVRSLLPRRVRLKY